MSVTAETFQSFISPYSLSRPYFGHLPRSSSSRHSAIAPRKLSCVIGTPLLFTSSPFLTCWWWWPPFNVEESIEAAAAAKACSPSIKWHNAREERNAKDIDTDDEEEEEEEEEESPRAPRAFTLMEKVWDALLLGRFGERTNEEKEGTRGKPF